MPGSLPDARARELMMGMKMPPARAVVDGMAGARTASAMDSPYARPSVLLPQAATNMLATLSPRPVFWKPCKTRTSASGHALPAGSTFLRSSVLPELLVHRGHAAGVEGMGALY